MIVGIDTSMAHTSVCVLRTDDASFCTPAPVPERLFEPPRHSAELLPAIKQQLERAEANWSEIDSIAVGVGPGTFTGLRIGIASARALGQALSVPLRPVSSLQALAAGIGGPADGRLRCPLIDARRNEVFAGLFSPAEVAPQTLWGPDALTSQLLVERLNATVEPIVAAGDWALKSRETLAAVEGIEMAPDPDAHAVGALQICLIGRGVEPADPVDVAPSYVRLPDAEINRVAQGGC